jgi:hypothetical protein
MLPCPPGTQVYNSLYAERKVNYTPVFPEVTGTKYSLRVAGMGMCKDGFSFFSRKIFHSTIFARPRIGGRVQCGGG